MVGRLLAKIVLILADQLLDVCQFFLFLLEVNIELVGLRELMGQLFLHFLDRGFVLLQLSFDGALQVFVLG